MIPTSRLGDNAHFIRGITFKPTDVITPDVPEAVVCMRTKNVQTALDQNDLIAIPANFVKRAEQYLQDGDLLISSANSWNLVGKCCWVEGLGYKATAGGFISILRADSQRLFPRYLYHWFSSPNVQKLVRSFGQKTTNISNLNIGRCLDLQIPLPSLAEQKRIAAILDKADALREKRRQAIAKLDTLLQSVFLDMFGDPVTNPKGWTVKNLESVAHVSRGRFSPRPRNDPQYYGGDIPFIQTGDVVKADTYIKTHRQTLNEKGLKVSKLFGKGTIAITIAANIGETALLTYDMCFPDSVVGIVPLNGNISNEFLEAQLRFFKAQLNAQATETAQKNINLEDLKPLKVLVPPIDLQVSFSQAVIKTQTAIEKSQWQLEKLDQLFYSLQHRAFSGEL